MTKKIYIKDESFDPIYREVSRGFYAKTRMLPSFLFTLGLIVFLSQVVLPVVVFKTSDESINLIDNITVVGRAAGFYDFKFDELAIKEDATKSVLAVNLERDQDDEKEVAGVKSLRQEQERLGKNYTPEYFYLTIPKLNIEDALVETNAETLDPSLALGHYPGTSLPGESGNAFIFGHSVLPWFFNQNNYKTIFSTLDRLEPGDEFYITYNNQEFTYVVESLEDLSPSEVDPLAEFKPKFLNESTVVLMTCSPPGTKLKRLLVNAVLVS